MNRGPGKSNCSDYQTLHSGTRIFPANQGWGLLNQFPPFRYFPNFSSLSKHTLAVTYRVYIWQVSPQLSCGDTCQILMWFEESNMYFCKIWNFADGEINERSFSNPNPWVGLPCQFPSFFHIAVFLVIMEMLTWTQYSFIYWRIYALPGLKKSTSYDKFFHPFDNCYNVKSNGWSSCMLFMNVYRRHWNIYWSLSYLYTSYLLNILFIFDRCRHSQAFKGF